MYIYVHTNSLELGCVQMTEKFEPFIHETTFKYSNKKHSSNKTL